MTMNLTCYGCGKQIVGGAVLTNPPLYLIQLGIEFQKAFHPKCYERWEIAAGRELQGKPQ
jgi:hypothetical protein